MQVGHFQRWGGAAPLRGNGAGPRGILAAVLVGSLLLSWPAGAGDSGSPSIAALKKNVETPAAGQPHDVLGRSTPFGTVLGFIKAAEREDLDRAAEFLDAQQIPKRSRKLAQEMAAVMDAADLRDLSRDPEGDLQDGLPPDRERVGVVKTASGSHEILLERVRREKDEPIWLFSADTLKWVPEVRADLGASPMERHFSGTILETRLLGYPLWRLIGVILVLPISYGIARVATGLLLPVIPALFRKVTGQPVDFLAAKLKWPLNLLAMSVVFYVISLVGFSAVSRVFWGYTAATVATISFTWIGLRLIDDVAGLIGGGLRPRIGAGGVALERFLTRLSKVAVVVAGMVILFYIAGVNLTALLTGVGIGGIALALAAQKSLENLFGAMTIISDKAIRVGDFCRAGEYSGIVEDIGMRSTRIRTPGRTVVTVPNGQLVTMSLENFALRDKYLFSHRIHLDYETSGEQMRWIVAEIRAVLLGHPKAETGTARVNLSAFRDLSIEVEIFAYILEASYEAFLVVQEELLMRIMDIVRASGARFAFPQALHLARERRVDL